MGEDGESAHSAEVSAEEELSFIDIGINLTDPVFRGVYHGRRAHEDDLEHVLERARAHGVRKLLVTGSDLQGSRDAIELAKAYPSLCYATVGVHPCNARQFLEEPGLLEALRSLTRQAAREGHCRAIGEIGLDYDRLMLCDRETQLRQFEAQLDLAVELHDEWAAELREDEERRHREEAKTGEHGNDDYATAARPRALPLFLHSRAAADDFARLLRPRLARLPAGGVVHSFTGTAAELEELLAMGLDVGINGCSLKTEANVAVAAAVPLDRLHLETDGPWCEVRPSSAGMAALAAWEARQAKESDRREAEDEGEGTTSVATTTADVATSPKAVRPLAPQPRAVKKERWAADCTVKGRNEPCAVTLVARAIAAARGVEPAVVARAAWRNGAHLFGLGGL